MTIGERIKARRIELGLTQEELAHRMGYKSRAAISNVEKGLENLTTPRVQKYADALETTPGYLMGWESKTPEYDIKLPDSMNSLLVEVSTKLTNNINLSSYVDSLIKNEAIRKLVDIASKCDREDLEMLIKMLERFEGGGKHEETE